MHAACHCISSFVLFETLATTTVCAVANVTTLAIAQLLAEPRKSLL